MYRIPKWIYESQSLTLVKSSSMTVNSNITLLCVHKHPILDCKMVSSISLISQFQLIFEDCTPNGSPVNWFNPPGLVGVVCYLVAKKTKKFCSTTIKVMMDQLLMWNTYLWSEWFSCRWDWYNWFAELSNNKEKTWTLRNKWKLPHPYFLYGIKITFYILTKGNLECFFKTINDRMQTECGWQVFFLCSWYIE